MKVLYWLAGMIVGMCVIGLVIGRAWMWMSYDSDALVAIGALGVLAGAFAMIHWVRFCVDRLDVATTLEKIAKTGLLLVLTLSVIGCTRIGPGHVGIVVNMAGSNKGVQDYPARTGWVFYNPATESVFEYPTYIQTAKWVKDVNEGAPVNEELTFTNSDQMQIAADVSIGYQLDPSKVPAFYVMFRSDDINSFTHGYLRNVAREQLDRVAGKYKIEQIMGDNSALLDEFRKNLQAEVQPYGVAIRQLGFIGAPRPPDPVIQAINDNNKAMQIARQKQNELAQVQADAAKVVAEADGRARAMRTQADAEAYSNITVSKSLTSELIQWRTNSKWNGQLPQVTGGGTVPLVTLK